MDSKHTLSNAGRSPGVKADVQPLLTLVIWHAAKPQPLAVAGMTHSTLYSRAGQNETLFREMAHNTPCSRVEYTGGPS
eukprot:1161113-Pelagomonas_calceolata.AAC.5